MAHYILFLACTQTHPPPSPVASFALQRAAPVRLREVCASAPPVSPGMRGHAVSGVVGAGGPGEVLDTQVQERQPQAVVIRATVRYVMGAVP